MATAAIWPGSSSFSASLTPFGLYDSDTDFTSSADKTAEWCAKRLGYPIVDVELQDIQFYAMFEEAVNEYGAQVNYNNIKNNLLIMKGQTTGSDLQQRNVNPSSQFLVKLSEQYGTEATVGGNVTLHTGSIVVGSGSGQQYDLDALWGQVSESGKSIEIRRVFYQGSPAVQKYFDPYVGTGMGSQQLLDGFGWGNYSPAVNYLLMPMYDDLLRVQAIEFNDTIRKSNYSFHLVNNKLRIYPVPTDEYRLYFEYYVKEDKNPVSGSRGVGEISDFSNIDYNNLTYSNINDAGKQWIRKYTLVLSKELLGSIRSKYGAIPGAKGDITLDGDTLRTEASSEKEAMITQLREDLEAVSRRNMMEREAEIAQFQNEQLQKHPYGIYLG
tara:strand:- start:1018 stop:2166 length:1149 start_codon:yes stop_codon:yes gene_type:complete